MKTKLFISAIFLTAGMIFASNSLRAQTHAPGMKAGDPSTGVFKVGSADFVASPTNKVVQMWFKGIDKSKLSNLEHLAAQAGFRGVEVDVNTGSVKVSGDPAKVTEATLKQWTYSNIVSESAKPMNSKE